MTRDRQCADDVDPNGPRDVSDSSDSSSSCSDDSSVDGSDEAERIAKIQYNGGSGVTAANGADDVGEAETGEEDKENSVPPTLRNETSQRTGSMARGGASSQASSDESELGARTGMNGNPRMIASALGRVKLGVAAGPKPEPRVFVPGSRPSFRPCRLPSGRPILVVEQQPRDVTGCTGPVQPCRRTAGGKPRSPLELVKVVVSDLSKAIENKARNIKGTLSGDKGNCGEENGGLENGSKENGDEEESNKENINKEGNGSKENGDEEESNKENVNKEGNADENYTQSADDRHPSVKDGSD